MNKYILLVLFTLFTITSKAILIKEVRSNNQWQLNLAELENQLLIFIGKDCAPCKLLIKELPCLKKEKINFKVLIYSQDEEVAFKEKVKLNLTEPLFMSNKELEKKLELKSNLTPTIVYLSENDIFQKTHGYKNCRELINYGKNQTTN